jgi:hypothetical protein
MNDYGDSSADVVVQTYGIGDTHTIDPEEWPAPYQTDVYTSDLHVVINSVVWVSGTHGTLSDAT